MVRVAGPSRRAVCAGLAAGGAALTGVLAIAETIPPDRLSLGAAGSVVRYGPVSGEAAVIFVPGANCGADRYRWLASLASPRVTVYILDPPAGVIPGVALALAGLTAARGKHRLLIGAGHSAGAAAMLDALDPISALASPRDSLATDYRPPNDVAAVAVMGCSLQPQMLNMVLHHRQESRPLTRPNRAPILFVSGDHDLLATPALMEKTRDRFVPPTELVVLPGGTHYGWTLDPSPRDNPAFGLLGGIDPALQQRETLAVLKPWIAKLS